MQIQPQIIGVPSDHEDKGKESPEDRFTRVAEARVNAILDKLRLLGQCANRKNYSYTEAQVNAIFRALNAEMRAVRAKFEGRVADTKRFRLKDS